MSDSFQDPAEAWESRLVWDYFKRQRDGVFVECGANHPVNFNQTWFLEQQGWNGLLIELNPELCALLRAHRPNSRTIETAVGNPAQVGEVEVRLAQASGHTSLRPDSDLWLSNQKVCVPLRTLDSILAESGLARIDFLSIDVEGLELDVLLGFNLQKWKPRLIFIEDKFENYSKHKHLVAHGYKLVRRTSYNNWYVPRETPVSVFSLSTIKQLIRLYPKMWLGPVTRVWENAKSKFRRRFKKMTSPPDAGKAKVAVVVPVFNQLPYTRKCVDSLNRAGVADAQITIVNNGSTDGTREFLATRPEIRTLHNDANRGCGFAWNQGSRISEAAWTIIMNNDILMPPGCLEGLLHFAEEKKIDVASPAMCQGEADYDFLTYAADFMRVMAPASRRNIVSGSFFMVHRRVFDAIGFFDDDPRLGGYEDDEFFRRVRRAGFHIATTGRAYCHHFGGITQKSIKASLNQPNMSLGNRDYYRKKTGQTWPKRKWAQLKTAVCSKWWKTTERLRYGYSLHEKRIGGEWHYC